MRFGSCVAPLIFTLIVLCVLLVREWRRRRHEWEIR